jgi:RHH-type proline utilization regulon transcriptional repressor/proline dehydrogenase/delta 1-pyrroline-5-carboxylate dehydrogenase
MDFIDAPRTSQSRPETPSLADLCAALLARKIPCAESIVAAIVSCESAHAGEFAREHDHFLLVGQDNVRRYLPIGDVRIRIHPDDTAFEIITRVCAAHVAGSRVTVSCPAAVLPPAVSLLQELAAHWTNQVEFVAETDEQLAAMIRARGTERVRFAAPERVPLAVLLAGNESGGCIVSTPVSGEGRLEMLWYLREQSISTDYHRYGNLGLRVNEKRAEVL